MNENPKLVALLFWILAAGVLAWGLMLAAGAYFRGESSLRAAMVAGCVTVFLAWWAVLWRVNANRLARKRRSQELAATK